jgi:hypothetical protein
MKSSGGPKPTAEGRCYCRAVAGDLPAALGQLVTELEGRGFAIVSDQRDDAHFGDRLLQLANPRRQTACAIRLVQDRGLWSVEVEIGGKWRDPYQVLLAFDGAKYGTRASSHEERLEFTLAVVDRTPQDPSALQPVVARLEEFVREYWRRLGVSDTSGI